MSLALTCVSISDDAPSALSVPPKHCTIHMEDQKGPLKTRCTQNVVEQRVQLAGINKIGHDCCRGNSSPAWHAGRHDEPRLSNDPVVVVTRRDGALFPNPQRKSLPVVPIDPETERPLAPSRDSLLLRPDEGTAHASSETLISVIYRVLGANRPSIKLVNTTSIPRSLGPKTDFAGRMFVMLIPASAARD